MKQPNSVTADYLVASFLIQDIARIFRQIVDREMRQLGLTRAQWFILNFSYLYEGVTQQELADIIDLGKSPVGKQVVSLEEKGWLVRKPHENDARSYRVYISDEKRDIVIRLNKLADKIMSPVLDKLNKSEVDELIVSLRSIELQLESMTKRTDKSVAKLRDSIAEELSS